MRKETAMNLVEVTSPEGQVHIRDNDTNRTICDQDASGWSDAVTLPRRAGLVLFCDDCVPKFMQGPLR
jgi:hypothetical protein